MEGIKLELNIQEQQVMDQLLSVMNTIQSDWNMLGNAHELGSAVHVIQGFIIQHMLHRLSPDKWNSWEINNRLSSPPLTPV